MPSRAIVLSPQSKKKARTKMFLDIPTAAAIAGFSIRQFRRIIEEDHIPTVSIGPRVFILGRDFKAWEETRKGRP